MAEFATLEAPPARDELRMASKQVSTRSKTKRDKNAANEIENGQQSTAERNDGDPGDDNQAATLNQESANGETSTPTIQTSTATPETSTSDTSTKRKRKPATKSKPSKAAIKQAITENAQALLKKQNELLLYIETWCEKATFGLPIDAQVFGAQLDELIEANVQLRASGHMNEELQKRVEKAKTEVATIMAAIDQSDKAISPSPTASGVGPNQTKVNDDNTNSNKPVADTETAVQKDQANVDESEQGTRQEDSAYDDPMWIDYELMSKVNTRMEERFIMAPDGCLSSGMVGGDDVQG